MKYISLFLLDNGLLQKFVYIYVAVPCAVVLVSVLIVAAIVGKYLNMKFSGGYIIRLRKGLDYLSTNYSIRLPKYNFQNYEQMYRFKTVSSCIRTGLVYRYIVT